MKRFILFILFFLFFAVAAAVFIKPVIIFCVEKQIKNIFPGSTVSIKGCDLDVFRRQISFKGGEFQYDKIKVDHINAAVRLEGKELVSEALSGRILNGKIGRAHV